MAREPRKAETGTSIAGLDAPPQSGVAERSQAKLTDGDLERLLDFERVERERLYRASPIWAAHRKRLLCVCLGQGSALHLIDGRNGIKDFDVWTFFARRDDLDPRKVSSAFRSGRHRDWGRSARFGARTDPEFKRRFPSFKGRNVDLFAAAIPAAPGDDPASAIQAWLGSPRGHKAQLLGRKAFVLLEPRRLEIIWPLEAVGTPLRGYAG